MLFRCTNQPFTRASSRVFRWYRWSKDLAGGEADGQSPTSGGRREPLAIASHGGGGGPLQGWMAGLEEGRWAMKISAKPSFFSGELVGGGLFGRLFHVYMAWYG